MKPPSERALEWRRLYESGSSTYQIGAAFGLSHVAVWKCLRRQGVVMRHVGQSTSAATMARVALREAGAKLHEIAARDGVSIGAVCNSLKRFRARSAAL